MRRVPELVLFRAQSCMEHRDLYCSWIKHYNVKSSPHYAYQFVTHQTLPPKPTAPVVDSHHLYRMSIALHYAAISPMPAGLGAYFRFEDSE
jgi:hypothetical protein